MKNTLKTTLILILNLLVITSFAQNIDLDNEEDDTIDDDYACIPYIEFMPEYTGGDSALLNFIIDNTKYPKIAREKNIEGIVYMNFIVEVDGSITDVKVLRGVCKSIDAESIRVTKLMPKWKPALQGNRAVRSSMNIPIRFVINDEEKLNGTSDSLIIK